VQKCRTMCYLCAFEGQTRTRFGPGRRELWTLINVKWDGCSVAVQGWGLTSLTPNGNHSWVGTHLAWLLHARPSSNCWMLAGTPRLVYSQYETTQKLWSHYSNFHHTLPDGTGLSTIAGDGRGSSTFTGSPTYGYCFRRFISGNYTRGDFALLHHLGGRLGKVCRGLGHAAANCAYGNDLGGRRFLRRVAG
jgi:hypothetical protein